MFAVKKEIWNFVCMFAVQIFPWVSYDSTEEKVVLFPSPFNSSKLGRRLCPAVEIYGLMMMLSQANTHDYITRGKVQTYILTPSIQVSNYKDQNSHTKPINEVSCIKLS